MSNNFYWKVLTLFCTTFLLGFIIFEVSYPLFYKQETSGQSKFIYQQKIRKALEKKEPICLPVDGKLMYQFMQEGIILVPKSDSNDNKLASLRREIVEIEIELEINKKLTKKQKIEKEDRLKTLKYKHPFYNYEQYDNIGERDLVYREVCKK